MMLAPRRSGAGARLSGRSMLGVWISKLRFSSTPATLVSADTGHAAKQAGEPGIQWRQRRDEGGSWKRIESSRNWG